MVNLLSRERQVWEVGGICAYVSSNSQRRMDRSELGDVRSYIIVFLAFAVAATLVYTATVALIVVTKIYRHYVHRLTMYLAAAGLLHAVAIGLEVIPIDLSRPDNSTVSLRDNWGEDDLTSVGHRLDIVLHVRARGIPKAAEQTPARDRLPRCHHLRSFLADLGTVPPRILRAERSLLLDRGRGWQKYESRADIQAHRQYCADFYHVLRGPRDAIGGERDFDEERPEKR